MAGEVRRAAERFRRAVETALPGTVPFLPGADDATLDVLEGELGRPWPTELRELLTTVGGQEDGISGPLNLLRFLRPEEVVAMHAMLVGAVGELTEAAAQPAPYRWETWSDAWIPFVAFQGDSYCIDTDPGETGTVGQVFLRPNVPDLEAPEAPSLHAFLDGLAERLETGAFELHEEEGLPPTAWVTLLPGD
ncbi:MAG TPA: SMI1/KNR4 family protein [Nocardioides sp.]